MIPDARFRVISANTDLSLDTVLAEVEEADTGNRYFAKSRGFRVPLEGIVKEDFSGAIDEMMTSKLLSKIDGVPSVHKSGVIEMLGNVYVYIIEDLCSSIGGERFCSDEELVRRILETTESIHRMGVIHNDIVPWNVMRYMDRPVIIDFGNSSTSERRINSFTGAFVDPSIENDLSMAIKTAVSIFCAWNGTAVKSAGMDWCGEIRKMDLPEDLKYYCINMIGHVPTQDIPTVGGAGSYLYHIDYHPSGGDLSDH